MIDITIYHEKPPCDKERLRKHMNVLKDIMIPPLTGRVVLDEYVEKLAQNADLFYAMEGEVTCGSCAVYLNQRIGYITSIGILPDFCRRGIGSKLIDEMIRVAKEYKIEVITLRVLDSNTKAVHFYEKFGFEVEIIEENWIKMIYKVK